MDETVIQETKPTAGEPEKTYTQKQLDTIIADRLSQERGKYADYETLKDKAAKYDAAEESQKSELQKANEKAASLQKELDKLKSSETARLLREKVAKELKVPANLLTADDEENLRTQAKAILDFAQGGGYPNVPDAGEAYQPTGGTAREKFINYFESLTN